MLAVGMSSRQAFSLEAKQIMRKTSKNLILPALLPKQVAAFFCSHFTFAAFLCPQLHAGCIHVIL